MNLSELSLTELETLAGKVAKAIAARQQKQRKEARAAVAKVAREYGMSVEDILAGEAAPKARKKPGPKPGKKRGKAKPKFRNPDDASQTWTGRGRRPAWFLAATKAGKSEDDLAI